ncbi:MAG TPA: hypothetical protein VIT18_00180 [Terrimicrobiaceae bacterium]
MGATTNTITLDVHSVERLLDSDGSPLLGPRIHPEAARSIFRDAEGLRADNGFQVAIRVPQQDLPRRPEVEAAIHRISRLQPRVPVSSCARPCGGAATAC